MIQALLIRRRGKVVPPAPLSSEQLPLEIVTSLSQDLSSLGYALTPPLQLHCQKLSYSQLAVFRLELIESLDETVGAHRTFSPMYPNFPSQVMQASEAELYFNAVLHYWSEGKLFPAQRKVWRPRYNEPKVLRFIDIGFESDLVEIFQRLLSANVAWSEQDRLDLAELVRFHDARAWSLIPERILQKENVAHLGALLLGFSTETGMEFIRNHVKTATDVLRLAVALSSGDVSLATASRFGTISRPVRRLLLEILESQPQVVEDMLRWKSRWIRLGERLHPHEFVKRYPKTAKTFSVIRNNISAPTLNSSVEKSLRRGDSMAAAAKLSSRPGDFTRRLDHILRLQPSIADEILDKFRLVVERVSTPVLLQSWHHFLTRNEVREYRAFFPKANVAKAFVRLDGALPKLEMSDKVSAILEETLIARFAEMPSLGRVYVDPQLSKFPVQFGMRSASKALRTVARGSRLPIPDKEILRMFLWWKNAKGRTDVDLSAALLDHNFYHIESVSFYNLQAYGGVHSGDIVDAPNGASEFIDVSVFLLRQRGVRYVAMALKSYSQQSFVELPECFAGWMARSKAGSGEVYEPRSVEDKLDLTANSKLAVPVVFDLENSEAIWCDLAVRHHPSFHNTIGRNIVGISLSIKAVATMKKPSLYDLLSLHAKARGETVTSPDDAETVFSVDAGTPFELDRIASDFLA